MTREEFIVKYTETYKRVVAFIEKSRVQGFLSLEKDLDFEKVKNRDVFEYGMNLIIDGEDREVFNKVMENLVNQEKDEYTRLFKKIQMEAVNLAYDGQYPRQIFLILNSYTDLRLDEDPAKEPRWFTGELLHPD